MADNAKSKDFEDRGSKIYFRRGRLGPFYQVSVEEKAALLKQAARLRRNMIILVSSFAVVFAATLWLLPAILDLTFQTAIMVVFGLVFVSFVPFYLMIRFHLGHQKKIRGILGAREGISRAELDALDAAAPKTSAEATPAAKAPAKAKAVDPRKGVNSGRLAAVFLLGVAITSIGAAMLYFSPDLPFRKQLIWWMNIITGSMLTGLGLWGLLRKKPEKPSELKIPHDERNDLP